MGNKNYKEKYIDIYINISRFFIDALFPILLCLTPIYIFHLMSESIPIYTFNKISKSKPTEKLKQIEKDSNVLGPLESYSNQSNHPLIYIGNVIKTPLLYVANTIQNDSILKDTKNSINEVKINAKEETVNINNISDIKEEKTEVKQITYYEKEINKK